MNNRKGLKIEIIALFLLGSINFLSCTKEKNQEPGPVGIINMDTISFHNSMKGWELYSWSNGNDWNYSVLVGTNRLKSYEEVTRNKIIVCGIDSLKMLLNKFPINEAISWIGEEWLESCWQENYGELSLPDENTLSEIRDYCILKKLILTVIN
ncbi:MAG: hypothetical protein NTV01_02130 [Bacteroidia bacterium]|nr:hypothetical protein [Bacteroidia bacterium]